MLSLKFGNALVCLAMNPPMDQQETEACPGPSSKKISNIPPPKKGSNLLPHRPQRKTQRLARCLTMLRSLTCNCTCQTSPNRLGENSGSDSVQIGSCFVRNLSATKSTQR
mmetsp:Transcript_27786/g.36165  ORF Transcript_27786/g.36165 Transcript_27786/m.36165 type:complete len:110 (+) Transcript_27786:114-443(+)